VVAGGVVEHLRKMNFWRAQFRALPQGHIGGEAGLIVAVWVKFLA